MKVSVLRGTGAVLAYLVASQTALADLTAKDVWSDWKSYMSSSGYDVSATEQMSGNTLTVTDISMTVPIDEPPVSTVTVTFGPIDFRENNDGSVAVIMPAVMPMRISGAGETSEMFSAQLNYTQSGHSMTAEGNPDDLVYTYAAESLALALSNIMVEGQDMSQVAQVNMSMIDVANTTEMKLRDVREYVQRMTVASLSYDMAFNDPTSEDGGTVQGGMSDLVFYGNANLPKELDGSDIQAMLDAGFSFDGGFEFAAGNTNFSGSDSGDVVSFASKSEGGDIKIAMDKSELVYDVSQRNSAINMSVPDLPFPISLDMALAGFRMALPIGQSDAPQDFGLAVTLDSFTMSDMIWGMLDPGAVLPRDPATIALDLAGKATVLFDLLDPEMAEAMDNGTAPPPMLNELAINKLLVTLAGAELNGDGDFVVDNTDMSFMGGFPKPTGALNLSLAGANGLLDKLIQMGLLSDQDAMGARMMMGMLAVPGDAPDTLKSKIEINAQGHILANGQRIQ